MSMAEKKVDGYVFQFPDGKLYFDIFKEATCMYGKEKAESALEAMSATYKEVKIRPVALQFLDEAQPPSASEMLEVLKRKCKQKSKSKYGRADWGKRFTADDAFDFAEQWLQKRGGK